MNDRLFKDLQSMKVTMPRPRTLFMGFGIWFAFCLILGLGLLGTVAYVAAHFIAKVW